MGVGAETRGTVKHAAGGRIPLSGMAARRMLERLELLCSCGAGLEAIASPFCAAVRDLLGSDAGSLFWIGADDKPLGFYHSNAPAELKDTYISQLDDRFLLNEPVNIVDLAATDGPPIGKMLTPGWLEAFWTGNIHRLLCAPLGHRYMLDMRANGGELGSAVFLAWNLDGDRFGPRDVKLLAPVQSLMERALRERSSRATWRTVSDATAHFITSLDGGRLLSIGPEAERVMMQSHLLGQNLSMTSLPRQAPGFARMLAAQMAGRQTLRTTMPVTDGRLVLNASRSRLLADELDDDEAMFVAVELQVAEEVRVIDRLMELELTPLQRRICLFAAMGGARESCADHFAVSAEALKKHLARIYRETGVGRWTDLGRLAGPA